MMPVMVKYNCVSLRLHLVYLSTNTHTQNVFIETIPPKMELLHSARLYCHISKHDFIMYGQMLPQGMTNVSLDGVEVE